MQVYNDHRLVAVSLFSGAGGLDVGFESAGFKTVYANEFDHDAACTWRANRSDAANVMVEGDIADHLLDLKQFAKSIDVLYGGPPCQGFSVAGKMDPDDPRSELVWRYMDAVAIVHPHVFVMENVAALGRLTKWRPIRERILTRASQLGYSVGYAIWRASDFGVPQNRERVIFIGIESNSTPTSFPKAMKQQVSVPKSLRKVLLSCGAYGTFENPQTCTSRVTLAKNPVMRRSAYAGMLVNGAGRPMNLNGTAATLPASMGGNKTPIIDEYALRNPSSTPWFEVYHQGLVEGTMDPFTAKVPSYMRRLTLREAAAIQTFPNEYIFCGHKTKQYRQIGNAVPCKLAEAVAKSVRNLYFSA